MLVCVRVRASLSGGSVVNWFSLLFSLQPPPRAWKKENEAHWCVSVKFEVCKGQDGCGLRRAKPEGAGWAGHQEVPAR